MKATYISYTDTHSFSQTVLSYLAHDPKLNPFISYFPSIENFGKLLTEKKVTANREVLTKALLSQYSKINTSIPPLVANNIELLKQENTYTITTGHQLNIFTGPLYFIFKIVSTINLAKELKSAYPDKNFVPVYWMASEDHDFAEINHTTVHGKKVQWDLNASGATGRLATSTIENTIRAYQNTLGISENSAKLTSFIKEAYLNHNNLADATRHLVNALFGEYGLVVLDADEISLKQQFSNIIKDDVLNQKSFEPINKTSADLKEIGFNTQVNAREINFFYMHENIRERLVYENGHYYVLDSDIKFTQEEITQEINQHPERFSPNVVMRPLYQEVILPNLAYIGGGAELVYWLQLKNNFEQYKIDFPILMLRNSALITNEKFSGKLCRLNICQKEIFKPIEEIKKNWVLLNSSHTLNLSNEWNELSSIFDKIKQQAQKIDSTLGPSTEAVKARLNNAIQNLEKKLIKADKRNHQEVLQQIESLKNKYFPGGGLQERVENFGPFYVKHGDDFIRSLINSFKPLDSEFTLLEPEI